MKSILGNPISPRSEFRTIQELFNQKVLLSCTREYVVYNAFVYRNFIGIIFEQFPNVFQGALHEEYIRSLPKDRYPY